MFWKFYVLQKTKKAPQTNLVMQIIYEPSLICIWLVFIVFLRVMIQRHISFGCCVDKRHSNDEERSVIRLLCSENVKSTYIYIKITVQCGNECMLKRKLKIYKRMRNSNEGGGECCLPGIHRL
jgi:hypothetical protein